jgi:signal transduction histidine kinase
VSLVLLDLPRAAAVTAAVTFGGGFAILARDGAGAGAFLEWALLCLVVASFLALGASTFGRLWRSELAARQAEADALTRLAESERQRASAERLAAVGRLAADVAHQVGSPIASVRSNLGFLDEELARQGCGAEATAALRESREAVERVSAIVAELRAQVAEEPAPRGRP